MYTACVLYLLAIDPSTDNANHRMMNFARLIIVDHTMQNTGNV